MKLDPNCHAYTLQYLRVAASMHNKHPVPYEGYAPTPPPPLQNITDPEEDWEIEATNPPFEIPKHAVQMDDLLYKWMAGIKENWEVLEEMGSVPYEGYTPTPPPPLPNPEEDWEIEATNPPFKIPKHAVQMDDLLYKWMAGIKENWEVLEEMGKNKQ